MVSIFNIPFFTANKEEISLSHFEGKYMLIVNVASKCGYTKQYEGLEALHKEFGQKQFTVLGFPCNQFGGQEPGTDAEIQSFCQLKFGTTFPVFAKIDVNGANAHPLYKILKSEAKGLLGTEAIKWNFTKFLVSPEGKVLKRYASATTPAEIACELRTLLK
jgi:glutathione peroxidase